MNRSKFLKLLFFPFGFSLYHLSGFFSRKSNVWVFGAQKNCFNDNTKHLYIYVTENFPEVQAIWITSSKKVRRKIRLSGGKAVSRVSIAGLYYTMISKFWFITTTVGEINYFTSKNAVAVNLWHGIPLKKIYFDTDNSEHLELLRSRSFLNQYVYYPSMFRLSNYLISSSDKIIVKCFSSALKVSKDCCFSFGQPRTDAFYVAESSNSLLDRWGSDELRQIAAQVSCSKYTWLYMPTWREANPNFLADLSIDFDRINDYLKQRGEYLILKLHLYTPEDSLQLVTALSNIIIFPVEEDVYPILKYCSCLITDYSSIYIDFLLLDKPMVFFSFDQDAYIERSRGFYHQYDDVTPGYKISTSREFENLFAKRLKGDEHITKRHELRDYFFDHTDGLSSERIVNHFFKEKQ